MTDWTRDGVKHTTSEMADDLITDERAWKDFEKWYNSNFTAYEVLLMFEGEVAAFRDWVDGFTPADAKRYGFSVAPQSSKSFKSKARSNGSGMAKKGRPPAVPQTSRRTPTKGGRH